MTSLYSSGTLVEINGSQVGIQSGALSSCPCAVWSSLATCAECRGWNRCFHFCIPYIYILYFLYVPDSLIRSVAVCAGSGSSVLRGVKADLWITGEMSHHEVLEANHNQTSVILCEHTNTERGYLYVLKLKLDKMFDEKLIVCVSKKDRDPLCVV